MSARHIPMAHAGICSAVRELCQRLTFATVTLEADIDPDTTVYVDIFRHIHDGFDEIGIEAVDVLKDTRRRACSLPNIAGYIGEELDEYARKMNEEAEDDFYSWKTTTR